MPILTETVISVHTLLLVFTIFIAFAPVSACLMMVPKELPIYTCVYESLVTGLWGVYCFLLVNKSY